MEADEGYNHIFLSVHNPLLTSDPHEEKTREEGSARSQNQTNSEASNQIVEPFQGSFSEVFKGKDISPGPINDVVFTYEEPVDTKEVQKN